MAAVAAGYHRRRPPENSVELDGSRTGYRIKSYSYWRQATGGPIFIGHGRLLHDLLYGRDAKPGDGSNGSWPAGGVDTMRRLYRFNRAGCFGLSSVC